MNGSTVTGTAGSETEQANRLIGAKFERHEYKYTIQGSFIAQQKYSIKEAAKLMGISRSNLRRLIIAGEMTWIKIGSKALILAQDIELFLQGHYVLSKPVGKEAFGQLKPLPEAIEKSEFLNRKSA